MKLFYSASVQRSLLGKEKGRDFSLKPYLRPTTRYRNRKGGEFSFPPSSPFRKSSLPHSDHAGKEEGPLGSFGDENPAKLPGRKEEEEEEGKQKILGGRGGEGGWMHRTHG